MDSKSYESRRRQQNRDAQRRYRRKQKQRQNSIDQAPSTPCTQMDPQLMSPFESIESPFSNLPTSLSGEGFDFQELSSSYGFNEDDFLVGDQSLPCVDAQGLYSNAYDLTEGISQDLGSILDGTFEDCSPESKSVSGTSSRSSLTPSSTRGGSRGSSRKHSDSGSYMSSAHGKIETKAVDKITELAQLYEIGVEMDILSPDDELEGSFKTMKMQFRRSARG